jgi:hypothetical protein
MNECIDSTMGHIPRMLAVLLASDDPRTSWSFQLVGYSVLKASNSLPSSATTSPIAAASKTSDVESNAPTAGVVVAPISTSSSGRVIRRPNHYKDTRR